MVMDKSQIIDTIIQYIRSATPKAKTLEAIPLDASLFESGILDSFAIIELVTFIESQWGVQIDDAELTTEIFGGINKIVELIEKKISLSNK